MVKRILIFLLVSVSALCQQSNGRNYTQQTILIGNLAQDANDSGDASTILTTPAVVPSGYVYTGYGPIHVFIISPDTSNNFGVALYNSSNTKLCSTTLAHPTSSTTQWFTFVPTGCGVPVAGATIRVAQLTLSSTQEPGTNSGAHTATGFCPGTSAYSGYVGGTTFPTTLGATTAQNFCYSAYVELYVAGGTNGRFYGGSASSISGIPNGPWSANGKWYGGSWSMPTYVNFSAGLVNGSAPTSTTLNNSTFGGAVTWSVANTHSSLTGSTSYTLPSMLTPVIVGSTGYGGAGGTSLLYTTGNGGDYITGTLGSSYSSLTVSGDLEFDIPSNDTSGNQYDELGVKSADGTAEVNFLLSASGSSLNLYAECNAAATGNQGIGVQPSTPYCIQITKNTNSGTNYLQVFNDTTGALLGTITCAAESGSHPANLFYTMVGGGEVESSGHHIWMKNIKISTTGGQVCP